MNDRPGSYMHNCMYVLCMYIYKYIIYLCICYTKYVPYTYVMYINIYKVHTVFVYLGIHVCAIFTRHLYKWVVRACVRVANVHLLKGHYLWYSLRYKIHASLIYIYMCVPMYLNMGNVTSVRYIFII